MAMQQIDPAVYDALLNMGGQIGGLDPQIAAQQQMANTLRGGAKAPEVRMSGRRAVAPGMMELLGNLAQAGGASSHQGAVTDLQAQQQALRQAQIQKIMAALQGVRANQADPGQGDQLQGPMVNPQAGGY